MIKKQKTIRLMAIFFFFLPILIVGNHIINIGDNYEIKGDNHSITIKTGQLDKDTLLFGTAEGPSDLDPHLAWDSASIDVIDQVAEGLFRYKFKDAAGNNINQIVPNLATDDPTNITSTPLGNYYAYFDGDGDGYDVNDIGDTDIEWNSTQVVYTFHLVQNATFHDGRTFNATSVKNSFDRLAFLLNVTGTLPEDVGVTQVEELYGWPNTRVYDGIYADKCLVPIINSTTIVSEFVIDFVLNKEYAPFIPLLTFSSSYIFIPLDANGQETLWEDYITTSTDGFLGTGPWIYDHYEDDVEVVFKYNPTYHRGASQVKSLVFSVINDANARNQALLAGDVHFIDDPLPSLYDTFRANPNTELPYAGPGLRIQYLGMNTQLLNVTWRNALSYAIDYDYITEEWWEGNAVRLESPIPIGITWANWSHQEATTNITKARMIIQSMGFATGLDPIYPGVNENEWANLAHNTPIKVFNFTYNIGNDFREDILQMLVSQSALIGVKIVGAGMTWTQVIYRLYEVGTLHRNMLQLWWIGWGPDYNDPSNFINPLFTNRSIASNGAQYDGYLAAQEAAVAYLSGAAYASTWVSWSGPYAPVVAPRNPYNKWDNVQLLMEEALSEVDPFTRQAMYNRIQMLLIEQDMPWAYGYVAKNYDTHITELEGYPYNTMGKVYFYPCVLNYSYYEMTINYPSNMEFTKGTLNNNIIWIISADEIFNPAYNISINGVLNQTGIWASNVPIIVNLDNLTIGIYTFQIEAKNAFIFIRDKLNVKVKPEEWIYFIPIFVIIFIIGLSMILRYAILIYRKIKKVK